MNNDKKIKDAVLGTIAEQHIQPISKWAFLARHIALWLPWAAITAIGALAVAGTLFGSTHAGWEFRTITYRSTLTFIIHTIPIIWLTSLAFFGIFVVKAFRITSNGYRYNARKILLASLTTSVIIGIVLFKADENLHRNALIRFETERHQRTVWTAPETGRIAGRLERNGKDWMLIDTNEKIWNLEGSILASAPMLDEGISVRMIGIQHEDASFLVCSILPWELTPFPPKIPRIPGTLPPHPFETLSKKEAALCRPILDQMRPPEPERKPF